MDTQQPQLLNWLTSKTKLLCLPKWSLAVGNGSLDWVLPGVTSTLPICDSSLINWRALDRTRAALHLRLRLLAPPTNAHTTNCFQHPSNGLHVYIHRRRGFGFFSSAISPALSYCPVIQWLDQLPMTPDSTTHLLWFYLIAFALTGFHKWCEHWSDFDGAKLDQDLCDAAVYGGCDLRCFPSNPCRLINWRGNIFLDQKNYDLVWRTGK